MFQENKARQIYQKTNISYPLIRTLTRLRLALLPYYRGTTCFHVFSENEDKFNGISIGLVYLQFWIVSLLCLIVGKENRESTQLTFTCSKSTTETLEKGVNFKHVSDSIGILVI